MENLILNNSKIEISNLIKKYLEYIDVSDNTANTYNVGLMQFNEYLKANAIKEPTREDIINFREILKETHKPTTINTYLIAIRNFYNWLEYEGICKDITKKIKGIKLEQIHLKRGLSKEEIAKVLSCCKDDRELLLVQLMISCALRVNEVVNITINDFYNDNGVVMLKVLGKGRDGIKQDLVKIDNRIYDLIKEYVRKYQITDYLFTSSSNHNKNGKLTGKTIRYIITNLFKKANLDMNMLSTHSTRHTSCELALANGFDIKEVSEFMRHKNIQTTIRYSKEIDKRESMIANNLCDCLIN